MDPYEDPYEWLLAAYEREMAKARERMGTMKEPGKMPSWEQRLRDMQGKALQRAKSDRRTLVITEDAPDIVHDGIDHEFYLLWREELDALRKTRQWIRGGIYE